MERNGALRVLQYGRHAQQGDAAVPSVHGPSLALQAYLRLARAPFEAVDTNDPHASPTDDLPVLVCDEVEVASGLSASLTWLARSGYVLEGDRALSSVQRAEAAAFLALLERLHLVQLYNLFHDEENYAAWTQSVYSQHYSFPLNWLVPRQLRQRVLRRLELEGVSLQDDEHIYAYADELYTALAHKLADRRFFFGDRPSTLDAVAFGYLMAQENARVPNARLGPLIRQHRNLIAFLNRLLEDCFEHPLGPLLYAPLEARETERTKDSDEYRGVSQRIVVAGLAAVLVYFFAFSHASARFL